MSTTAGHAERVALLESLAVLRGYVEQLALPGLPDGRCPDVLRFDSRRRGLFVADAKDSETAGNTETRTRLQGYLAWFAAHIRAGGEGVFAVCFAGRTETARWLASLDELRREVGIGTPLRATHFGMGTWMVWLEVGGHHSEWPA